jgi:hypothetical protein
LYPGILLIIWSIVRNEWGKVGTWPLHFIHSTRHLWNYMYSDTGNLRKLSKKCWKYIWKSDFMVDMNDEVCRNVRRIWGVSSVVQFQKNVNAKYNLSALHFI